MSLSADMKDLDLYAILGVERAATDKQIISAYRKRALKCHPDKNPDNPSAAELFHQLSKALELLTDPAARAAYNKVLDGKAAAEARHKKLDSERKRFKEDLEAREKAALGKATSDTTQKHSFSSKNLSPAELLKREMDRLREEGSELLKAEQERLRRHLKDDSIITNSPSNQSDTPTAAYNSSDTASYRLRLKWRSSKTDIDNGGYSTEVIEDLFKKQELRYEAIRHAKFIRVFVMKLDEQAKNHRYGEVAVVLVSSKKKGSAIVEFTTYVAALSALHQEGGLSSNPLTISWLSAPPEETDANAAPIPKDDITTLKSMPSVSSNGTPSAQPLPNERDFESVVLMRLRQAQERKKLEQELLSKDDEQS